MGHVYPLIMGSMEEFVTGVSPDHFPDTISPSSSAKIFTGFMIARFHYIWSSDGLLDDRRSDHKMYHNSTTEMQTKASDPDTSPHLSGMSRWTLLAKTSRKKTEDIDLFDLDFSWLLAREDIRNKKTQRQEYSTESKLHQRSVIPRILNPRADSILHALRSLCIRKAISVPEASYIEYTQAINSELKETISKDSDFLCGLSTTPLSSTKNFHGHHNGLWELMPVSF